MRIPRITRAAAPPSMRLAAIASFIILCALTAPALGQQPLQTGTVTYRTSTTAYVDLGSNQGFTIGDTLHVGKAGVPVATLVVAHIASKSMATDIVTARAPFVAGDRVTGVPRQAPQPIHPTAASQPTGIADTTAIANTSGIADTIVHRAGESAPPRPVPPQLSTAGSEPPSTRITGRLSLQYYGLTSTTSHGFDFSQPAAVLSLSADNLFAMPLSFAMYSNHRYDARATARITSGASQLQNRIYQLSLQYGTTGTPFNAIVGRFIAPAVGGVGTFDGGMVAMRSGGWEAGLAGGSQPGYRASEFTTEDPKFAAYTSYTAGDYASMRYQGSLAFAQTYKSGALDRGFLYVQNVASFGGLFSLYQNANLDLYDLRDGRGAASLHLSDLFLSSTWRPLQWLSVNGSWALRRNVWYLRSFGAVADSLFDRALMNNLQLSVGLNLPSAMFVSVTGSLRTKEGDPRDASALQGRWTWSNAFDTETNLYLNGSWADNIYSRSTGYGAELSRDLIADMYASLRVQHYGYAFPTGARTLDRNTLSLDLYYRLSRSLYVNLSIEQAWEGTVTSNRFFGDVSVRW